MHFGIIEFIVLTIYSKSQTLTRPHYIKNTNCQACFVVFVVVTESSKYSKEKLNSSQKYSHCRNFQLLLKSSTQKQRLDDMANIKKSQDCLFWIILVIDYFLR